MHIDNEITEGQKNNSDNEKSIFNFLKEKFIGTDLTTLLSLSSLIAYGIYYFYQWTFLDYYHIDKQFIDFSKQGIASIIILLVLVITLLFLLTSLSVEPIFLKSKNRLKKIAKIMYISMLVINLISAVLTLFTDGWDFFSNRTIILVILVIPIAVRMVFDDIKKLKPVSLIGLTAAFTLGASCAFGEYRASTKTNYYVLNKGEQKYVVIAPYEKQFIIAPVNLDKQVILPQIQFIDQKSGKDEKVELTPVHTGKLKVKDFARSDLK
jgi:magnesium-transporting ATPase (P-type)